MILAAQFFGRLHPLLVHLPIGILFLAALFELLSYFPKYRQLRQAVQTALLWGTIGSIAAVASGLMLSQEGGYDDRLLAVHRNTGIATAVFAFILLMIRRSAITFFKDKEKRKLVRIFLFIPLIGLLSLAGHLGGSLTHGEDYLFASAPDESLSPEFKLTASTDLDSVIVYKDVIEPVLKSRCYTCHSASKQKGQLRLDLPEYIRKGGKHGIVLSGVVTDSAALYARLMLPLEDEKHMPPNEKPQLTSSEIALIHGWIDDGAPFDKPLGMFQDANKLKGFIHALIDKSMASPLIPLKEVQPAQPSTLEELTARKILVIPLGSGTNYLSVSFVNARKLGDEDLKSLLPIKDQMIWLNVGRTMITDTGLETIGQFSNLTQLNLEYTQIKDEGLAPLTQLTALHTLNLVGTSIGDNGVLFISEIKSLKKVFLYQSKVTPVGITTLHQNAPHVLPDTGSYQLPFLVTDTLVYRYPKKK